VIILDVMLPGRDGWSVVADLRRREITTPVLFLTARDAVHDRVKGLELGGDDYLVKPFAFSELLACVRSILRRGPERQSPVLKFAGLELVLYRHRAARESRVLDLTPKEFQLLSLLMRRAGEAEAQSRSLRDLFVNSTIAVIGIVLLLSIVTRNANNLLLVLASLPFGFVGAVLAVFASGGLLSLGSMVGFVPLLGITLRNSILMIAHYEHLVGFEGKSWSLQTAIE
jgi:hypothetical protein